MSLSPDSPLHNTLLFLWKSQFRLNLNPTEIRATRSVIFEQAAEQIRARGQEGTDYLPENDHRVKWALAWLNAKATGRSVDPEIKEAAAFLFEPLKLSGKDLASGEQPETLALGS